MRHKVRGFGYLSQNIIMIAVVLLVGAGGTIYLTATHADAIDYAPGGDSVAVQDCQNTITGHEYDHNYPTYGAYYRVFIEEGGTFTLQTGGSSDGGKVYTSGSQNFTYGVPASANGVNLRDGRDHNIQIKGADLVPGGGFNANKDTVIGQVTYNSNGVSNACVPAAAAPAPSPQNPDANQPSGSVTGGDTASSIGSVSVTESDGDYPAAGPAFQVLYLHNGNLVHLLDGGSLNNTVHRVLGNPFTYTIPTGNIQTSDNSTVNLHDCIVHTIAIQAVDINNSNAIVIIGDGSAKAVAMNGGSFNYQATGCAAPPSQPTQSTNSISGTVNLNRSNSATNTNCSAVFSVSLSNTKYYEVLKLNGQTHIFEHLGGVLTNTSYLFTKDLQDGIDHTIKVQATDANGNNAVNLIGSPFDYDAASCPTGSKTVVATSNPISEKAPTKTTTPTAASKSSSVSASQPASPSNSPVAINYVQSTPHIDSGCTSYTLTTGVSHGDCVKDLQHMLDDLGAGIALTADYDDPTNNATHNTGLNADASFDKTNWDNLCDVSVNRIANGRVNDFVNFRSFIHCGHELAIPGTATASKSVNATQSVPKATTNTSSDSVVINNDKPATKTIVKAANKAANTTSKSQNVAQKVVAVVAAPINTVTKAVLIRIGLDKVATNSQTVLNHTSQTTGCGAAVSLPVGESTLNTIQSGGLTRSYRIYLPANYDNSQPHPVILSFHGHGSNAQIQEDTTNFDSVADENGVIMVYPNGQPDQQGYLAWNTGLYPGVNANDVQFVSDILNQLQTNLRVQTSRIYATGFSNGGGFTNLLACTLGDRIAAFAPASGSYITSAADCHVDRPIPIIEFHGTADMVNPIAGAPAKHEPPLATWESGWLDRNGCKPQPTVSALSNVVTKSSWTNCKPDADLVQFMTAGEGHEWPKASFGQTTGSTSGDLDAAHVIWRFFNQHTLS